MVKSVHPGVTCLAVPRETWNLPALLPGIAALDRLSLTLEDRAKPAMYAQQRQRNDLRGRVTSLDDYLRQLDLRMTIEAFVKERHLDRAVQLLQKTNQFNLTTRRHSESDVLGLLQAGSMIHLASLADRFGDYGRIALSIVVFDEGAPVLDTFLMSCRALGRKAESVFLNFIKRKLRSLGFQTLRAHYVPSGRNRMCADFLAEHDFQPVGSPGADDVRTYQCPLPELASNDAEFYQVRSKEEA
jgi:FkbH-like protein